MNQRYRVIAIVLVIITAPSVVFGDPGPVAGRLTQAQTPDGQYISWKEHIVDDPIVGNEPDLAGSDGLEMSDLDGDGIEDVVSVHEADIVYPTTGRFMNRSASSHTAVIASRSTALLRFRPVHDVVAVEDRPRPK